MNIPRILVVSSDGVQRMQLCAMARMQGCEAASAKSAEEACQYLSRQSYGLILLDFEQGYSKSVLRLREAQASVISPAPIIALMPEDTIKEGETFSVLDMNGYLYKPVQAQAFAALIGTAGVSSGATSGAGMIRPEARVWPDAPSPDLEQALRMHKAVLCEDDWATSKVVGHLVSKQGFSVSVANNGDDGLALINKERPELLILDINMPVKDGLTVLREVRQLREDGILDADIHIIVLTNHEKPGLREEALALGAKEFWNKPFRPREFNDRMTAIAQAMNVHAPSEGASEQYIPLPV